MAKDKPKPLVYTVGEPNDKVNVCVDCYTESQYDTEPDVIRNTPAFGNQVPYPECWLCGEVARPETLSNHDAEPPEWMENGA